MLCCVTLCYAALRSAGMRCSPYSLLLRCDVLCHHLEANPHCIPSPLTPAVATLFTPTQSLCSGYRIRGSVQAADQGIGGSAWDYKDMRSQQLLSRLIEKMRAAPQPIVCAVQVR